MKRRPLSIGAWSALLTIAILLLSSYAWRDGARAAGQTKGAAAFAAGMAAARTGSSIAAAHDFEQALLQGHTDPNTFYQLGLAYSKLKRWNDATWALATAASDDVFAAMTPQAQSALAAASNAGGADVGAPSLLRNVQLTHLKLTPTLQAQIESRSAVAGLRSNSAFFIGPSFGKQISVATTGVLTQAAADLQNQSNTVVKFVFLSATPAPYTSLSAYAKDLFHNLGLQRAVVVVVTPGAAGAFSDRLSDALAAGIVRSQRSRLGTGNLVALAAGIARAVTSRADDNEATTTQRSVILGVLLAAALCAVTALAIWRVARREPAGQRGRTTRSAGLGVKSRVR